MVEGLKKLGGGAACGVPLSTALITAKPAVMLYLPSFRGDEWSIFSILSLSFPTFTRNQMLLYFVIYLLIDYIVLSSLYSTLSPAQTRDYFDSAL